MPYKREGKKVLHFKDGKWSVKQTCSSAEAAEEAIRLLHGIDHGMKPRHHSSPDGSFIDERRKRFGL